MQDRARSIEESRRSREGRRGRACTPEAARGRRRHAAARVRVHGLAAIGLGAVFLHLKAEVNWHRLFMELIADFDVAELEQRQSEALTRNGLQPPTRDPA